MREKATQCIPLASSLMARVNTSSALMPALRSWKRCDCKYRFQNSCSVICSRIAQVLRLKSPRAQSHFTPLWVRSLDTLSSLQRMRQEETYIGMGNKSKHATTGSYLEDITCILRQ